MTYHPWRWLRDHLPDVDVITRALPADMAGYWDGARTIVLHHGLTQAARRSTLAHELAHVERGIIPVDPVLLAREEAVVDEIAARMLIPLDVLIDALRWCRGVATAETAEELWTDQHAMRVRLATLTAAERAQVETALANCDWVA